MQKSKKKTEGKTKVLPRRDEADNCSQHLGDLLLHRVTDSENGLGLFYVFRLFADFIQFFTHR